MRQNNYTEQLVAAGVHSFTALGAFTGFLSIISILHDAPATALLWLGAAMVIDGLDGPMARHFKIGEKLPFVDGTVLDHVIDYLTYALIPAVFLYYFQFIPGVWGIVCAAVILMTSLYSFANTELKTNDNFFDGFPATWNLVVLGFYLLDTGSAINSVVVISCGALTFFPVKFIHPFRVKALRPITIAMTVIWAILAVYLISQRRLGIRLPTEQPELLTVFLVISSYFLALSIVRSIRGRLL
mgnify:CR=1 FL=1